MEDQNIQNQSTSSQISSKMPDVKKSIISLKIKNILVFVGVVISFLLILGVVLFVRSRQSSDKNTQDTSTKERILPNDQVVATVGSEKILSQDLLDFASVYLAESVLKKEDLPTYLDILVERKILDIEAKEKNITIDQAKLTEGLDEGLKASAPSLYQRDKMDKYYTALKNDVTASFTSSFLLHTVGFWIPAPTDPDVVDVPDHETKRADGLKAMQEIESKIKAGEHPYDAAVAVLASYPSLENILAYNGGIIKSIDKESVDREPKEFALSVLKMTRPYIYDGVLQMKSGEIKTLIDPSQRGMNVVYLTSSKTGQYNSYDDFLEKKSKELVKKEGGI